MKYVKQQLVSKIIALMEPGVAPTVKQAINLWFMNIRPSGGMRLTDCGYNVLTDMEFEFWPVEVPDLKNQIKPPQLLALDRKIQIPYYIDYRHKRLVFFGSKDAMLMTLLGDLNDFIKKLK